MVSALGGKVKAKRIKDEKIEHCIMEINGSTMYVADGTTHPRLTHIAKSGKIPHLMCHIDLPDPQPLWDRLLKNGAKTTIELEVQFWGGTYGAVRDVMGVEWSLSKANPNEEKCNFGGVIPYIHSLNCDKHIDWIQKVFAAEIKDIFRSKEKMVMHCHVAVNGGQLYLCDQSCSPKMEGVKNSDGVMLHVCLPDPDMVWKKAMSNGAEQVLELKQQFWGGYFGCFRDPLGVKWGVIKSCGQ